MLEVVDAPSSMTKFPVGADASLLIIIWLSGLSLLPATSVESKSIVKVPSVVIGTSVGVPELVDEPPSKL